jgi:hypothetical protein
MEDEDWSDKSPNFDEDQQSAIDVSHDSYWSSWDNVSITLPVGQYRHVSHGPFSLMIYQRWCFSSSQTVKFPYVSSHFQTHQTSIAPEQTTPEEWKCVSSLAKEFAPWTKGCQGSNTLGKSIKIYKSKSMGFLRYVHPTIHKIWISIMDDMYDTIFDVMNIHLQLGPLFHRHIWEGFNQNSHRFGARRVAGPNIFLPEGHLCWLLQHMSLSWNWVQPFYIVLWLADKGGIILIALDVLVPYLDKPWQYVGSRELLFWTPFSWFRIFISAGNMRLFDHKTHGQICVDSSIIPYLC